MFLGFIILLAIGAYHPDMTERTKFTTGAVLAFFTLMAIVFQAYIYTRQWDAMRKQSEIMSASIEEGIKTRELDNRAWVNAERAELIKPIDIPPAHRFSIFLNITVRNTGPSVAADGIAFIYALPNLTTILSRDWNKPCETTLTQRAAIEANRQYNPWPVGFVLVPGQTAILPIGTSSDDITPEQAKAGDYYVLGCATYRDQFGKMHTTRFCFRPIKETGNGPTGFHFEICNAFQSAD